MSIWCSDSSSTQAAHLFFQRFHMDYFHPFTLLLRAQNDLRTCEEEPSDRIVSSLITPGVPWTLRFLSDLPTQECCGPVANNILISSPTFYVPVLSQALAHDGFCECLRTSWLIQIWAIWYSQWLTITHQGLFAPIISRAVVAHRQATCPLYSCFFLITYSCS